MAQESTGLKKNKNIILFSLRSGLLGWLGLLILAYLNGEIHNMETFLSIFQGDGLLISFGVFVFFFVVTALLIKIYHKTSGKIRLLLFSLIALIFLAFLIPFIQYEYANYKEKELYKLQVRLKEITEPGDIKKTIAKIPNERINQIDFGGAAGRNIICTKDVSILQLLEGKDFDFKKKHSYSASAITLVKPAIVDSCYNKEMLAFLLDNILPSREELSRLIFMAALEEDNLRAFKQLIEHHPLSNKEHWYLDEFYNYGSVKVGYGAKSFKPKYQKYMEYLTEVVPLNENTVRDGEEINALSIAIKNGDTLFTKILLDKGANVNQVYHKESDSIESYPLQMALYFRKSAIAKILIEAGAEVNKPISSANTSYPNYLSYFLQKRYSDKPINNEVVKMLKKHTNTIDKKSLELLKKMK